MRKTNPPSSGEHLTRAFICIEIPDSIKQRLDALGKALARVDCDISWVKSSNIHITLKFLGGVSNPVLERVRVGAVKAAAEVEPFDIEVGGVGCFPTLKSPRVLWVGLTETPSALRRLHEALEDEMKSIGFAKESRPFSPHLTIARLKSPRDGAALSAALVETGFDPEAFVARELVVMRSELRREGALYTPIQETALGKRAVTNQTEAARK